MPLDDYDPSTALSAYYTDRTERRLARLWATEKLLHDLRAVGIVDFFEGAGSDPTALDDYASDKIWLRVSSGVTEEPGEIRMYDGSGDATQLANWPELTAAALAAFIGAFSLSQHTSDNITQGVAKLLMTTAERAALVTLANAFIKGTDDSDDITEGATNLLMTAAERARLAALGTAGTPEFAAVNIGAATDTTLTRAAAGKAAVEGVNLLRTAGDETLTGGFAATSIDDGTKSSGTFTPTFLGGNIRRYVNGGAHTLAPPTGEGSMVIQVTNNGSAGAVTTSGFTKVTGDTITTTNGHDFFFDIRVVNGFSQLHVTALQ